MGLSLSMVRETVFGNRRVKVVDVTFDASYPTNGEALTPANLGLQTIDLVLVSPDGGYLFAYDYTNQKLKAFTPVKAQAAHSHTENTAVAYTQNATTATGGAITAAAAAEVANTTDLSSVTCRLVAIGV